MKIPICPKCLEPNTLKFMDYLDLGFGSVAAIRCLKTHGGCGELFMVDKIEVHDSQGLPAEIYREEDKIPGKRTRRKRA
jgi:hypothetical protein